MSSPQNDRYLKIDCSKDKIRTKQSFKKEVNINTIMAKFAKTGMITPEALAVRQAVFGDVSSIGDFHDCQNRILEAKDAFMTLSAEVRTRFGNDTGQLLEFLQDPENKPEAIELGILPKEPVEAPEPAPVPPTTPPAET